MAFIGTQQKCKTCDKTVYVMDQVSADGVSYHKACFKCTHCKGTLKWKFAFLSLGRPEYLQDSDIVSSRFQRRDVYGAWEQYLGLEHSDSTPKRAYAANQNRHTFEKPVKIYN